MKLLIAVAAVALSACAAPGPSGPPARHLQVKEPFGGKPMVEMSFATPEGCRLTLMHVAKQQHLRRVEDMAQCSGTSIASDLPYRATVRMKATDAIFDWHFLTMSLCEEIVNKPGSLNDATLVAGCSRK